MRIDGAVSWVPRLGEIVSLFSTLNQRSLSVPHLAIFVLPCSLYQLRSYARAHG